MANAEFSDDAQFRLAVSAILDELLEQIDEIDSDDLDPRLTSGNLQILFEESNSTFVLSQQTPTHELWLSANLRAWHFVRKSGQWIERDTGEPMTLLLSRLFSEKVGSSVEFEL
mgnify:CR=1 FL=1